MNYINGGNILLTFDKLLWSWQETGMMMLDQWFVRRLVYLFLHCYLWNNDFQNLKSGVVQDKAEVSQKNAFPGK